MHNSRNQSKHLIFSTSSPSHFKFLFPPKIPFGIAQIGKAFRNEITPRNFIFRSREFEQMEIEYFIPDGDEDWGPVRFQNYNSCSFLNVYLCTLSRLFFLHVTKQIYSICWLDILFCNSLIFQKIIFIQPSFFS